MAEPTDAMSIDESADQLQPRTRRAPDVLALVVGLVSLATAVFAIVGYVPPLPSFDPWWLLAGAAALVGLLLLMSSLRRPRERGDS